MAGPLARLYATFGLDAREFESGAGVIRRTVDRLGGTAATVGTVFGAATGTAAVGVLGLADDYKDATDTIRIGTGATGAALADLESQFRSVGGRVPDDMGLVSQVIADLNTRTGQTGEGLGKLAEQILDLSRLTGTDAAGNVANLTRLYGDWSIATEDQAAANDQLFRASQATGIGLDALSQQVVQFGAPLRNIGFEFEEAISLLAKWEKEGVNTTLSLGGLKIALGTFAKQGVDAKDGLEDLVDQITNTTDATEAMALGVKFFGSRAGPDMVAAIREGRFATEDLLAVVKDGGDTISGLSDETRDAGDAFAELKNQAALFIGPFVKDLGGLGEALGSTVYLLPALGSALGNGLGRLWTKSGAGAIAAKAAGVIAGVAYQAGAFVASKFTAAATAIWTAVGGGRVVAAAGAAGKLAGTAYGKIAGVALVAGLALVASEYKPVTDQLGKDINESIFGKPEDMGQGMLSGTIFDSIGDGIHEAWDQAILNDPLRSEEGKAAYRSARNYQQALERGLDSSTISSIIGGNVASGMADAEGEIKTAATDMSGTLAAAIIGGNGPSLDGVITKPIDTEFSKAVAAVRAGFGSVKQALANPPQLISKKDRLGNMSKRVEKAMGQLHKAVKANDPVNVAYWTAAVQKAQQRMDKMKGKAVGTNAGIRQEFKKTGTSVDGTWLGVEQSVRSHSQKAKGAAVGAMQGAKTAIGSMSLAGAGASLMGTLISGIQSMIPRIQAIAHNVASTIASFFKSNSPPKVGPLSTIDKDGASLMDVWMGGISSRKSRVAATGRQMAGAFQPRPGMSMALAGGGGRGDEVHIHVGTLIADEAGLDELDRRMSKRRNRTSRGRRLPSERVR